MEGGGWRAFGAGCRVYGVGVGFGFPPRLAPCCSYPPHKFSQPSSVNRHGGSRSQRSGFIISRVDSVQYVYALYNNGTLSTSLQDISRSRSPLRPTPSCKVAAFDRSGHFDRLVHSGLDRGGSFSCVPFLHTLQTRHANTPLGSQLRYMPICTTSGRRRVALFESAGGSHLHPSAPYTLHPTPYTLHPTPHTLHATPQTLNPEPRTLKP